MSKHHVILKSKTLDVPIIITSSISDESQFNFSESNDQLTHIVGTKYKLDKGFSLDSHYLHSQNSLSSSSTSNDLTSTPNSVSSSNSSLQSQLNTSFQFHNQKYLQPPPVVNLTTLTSANNINADFEVNNLYYQSYLYEDNRNLEENQIL
ncbi:unnamed protein product [Brachionus calyciflorus]|uniref:Uncharacterized protein n=1 Tax=Brachionus calyciflorus TaxID=104777 RepID=A0A813WYL2_9BILA|nr:unnamed protein product [Brachionus calyciflorus]